MACGTNKMNTLAHTLRAIHLTEVDDGLDLLWRNDVRPENVIMGVGFYGRSFTMADPSCHQPDRGCQFSAAAFPTEI